MSTTPAPAGRRSSPKQRRAGSTATNALAHETDLASQSVLDRRLTDASPEPYLCRSQGRVWLEYKSQPKAEPDESGVSLCQFPDYREINLNTAPGAVAPADWADLVEESDASRGLDDSCSEMSGNPTLTDPAPESTPSDDAPTQALPSAQLLPCPKPNAISRKRRHPGPEEERPIKQQCQMSASARPNELFHVRKFLSVIEENGSFCFKVDWQPSYVDLRNVHGDEAFDACRRLITTELGKEALDRFEKVRRCE